MAAPLSGVGQQQIPLSQPFQPGGSDQTRDVRQQNQVPREDEVQARGEAPAQTQDTNTQKGNENFAKSDSSNNQGRGSLVDIVV